MNKLFFMPKVGVSWLSLQWANFEVRSLSFKKYTSKDPFV